MGEQGRWRRAQAKGRKGENFDIRKQLLKFDDVMERPSLRRILRERLEIMENR